jgi:gamma-glutamylcyclotransferase (GGCT)/AIG2-like uncharacterized protein YtfP
MNYDVFVYGTLRKNERYHTLLKSAKLKCSQGWTFGKLYDTGLGYPAMHKDDSKKVYGEIYSVSAELLKVLDQLEGYHGSGQHNEYTRTKQTVFTDQGQVEAYVYLYNQKLHPRQEIELGDWKCHQHLSNKEFLYFAYGSCMDDERFIEAGVEGLFNKVAGRGVLPNFSLRYTRRYSDGARADIVEIGGKVEGKVYRVTPEAVAYLFQREGVYAGAYRPAFIEIELNGKTVSDALTFIVIDKEEEAAPPEWYAQEIIRGGKGTLSLGYLKEIKEYLRVQFQLDVS